LGYLVTCNWLLNCITGVFHIVVLNLTTGNKNPLKISIRGGRGKKEKREKGKMDIPNF